jgi:hypothetical protein
LMSDKNIHGLRSQSPGNVFPGTVPVSLSHPKLVVHYAFG